MKQYRLYIDEYGTDHFDTKHLNVFDKRFLCVVGLAVSVDKVSKLQEDIEAFKNRTLRSKITDIDEKSTPIILHRIDIENKRGVFRLLSDNAILDEFNSKWLDFLGQADFKIISVMIDKASLLKQTYYTLQDPYHYAAHVIVEKYVQFLERHNATGDIMPEERKGKKDKELQFHVDNVIKEGTRFVATGAFDKRLSAKKLKFRPKKDNVCGLQMADMIAKTCAKYAYELKHKDKPSIMKGYELELIKVIKNKYDISHQGGIWGYGIKYLP